MAHWLDPHGCTPAQAPNVFCGNLVAAANCLAGYWWHLAALPSGLLTLQLSQLCPQPPHSLPLLTKPSLSWAACGPQVISR